MAAVIRRIEPGYIASVLYWSAREKSTFKSSHEVVGQVPLILSRFVFATTGFTRVIGAARGVIVVAPRTTAPLKMPVFI